jgi:hypothetical protein
VFCSYAVALHRISSASGKLHYIALPASQALLTAIEKRTSDSPNTDLDARLNLVTNHLLIKFFQKLYRAQ